MTGVVPNKRLYLSLVDRFPLVPIRNGRHLDEAIGVADELTAREHLAPEEKQYLDVLSDLIEKYEEEHHPMQASSPVEALAFLMETNHLRQADVGGHAESVVDRAPLGKERPVASRVRQQRVAARRVRGRRPSGTHGSFPAPRPGTSAKTRPRNGASA